MPKLRDSTWGGGPERPSPQAKLFRGLRPESTQHPISLVTSDTSRPRFVRYRRITCSKHTTLPYKFVMFSGSKPSVYPGAPEALRPHCAPLTRGFFVRLKIIFALMPQGLTSFDSPLPDKKLLPFCRGPPSVGACAIPRTTHKEPHHVQVIQTPSRPRSHPQRSANRDRHRQVPPPSRSPNRGIPAACRWHSCRCAFILARPPATTHQPQLQNPTPGQRACYIHPATLIRRIDPISPKCPIRFCSSQLSTFNSQLAFSCPSA